MRKLTTAIVCGLAFVGLAMGNSSCGGSGGNNADSQREKAVQSRANAFAQAQALYPDPQVHNFPLRKALVDFTARQDELNHPWYIYLLGQNGNPIGYYVGKTAPQNACDYLSSTQQINDQFESPVTVTAPSFNGYYSGGAGSSAACDQYFFLDQTTNAVIQIQGLPFWVSDQPLSLDVQPIKVKVN